MAGLNINQLTNIASSLLNTDKMYLGRSPFGATGDYAILGSSLYTTFGSSLFNGQSYSASATPLQLVNPLPTVISITLTSASQVSLPAMNAQVPRTIGRSYLIYNAGNPATDSPFEITAQDTTTVILPRLEIGETAILSVLSDSTANGTWLAEVIPDYYIETRIINGGNIGTTIALDLVLGNVLETSTSAAFTASAIGTNGIVLGLNWWFKNNSSSNLTFTPSSPNLIDGNASLTLAPNQSAQIVCDGTQFNTIAWNNYNPASVAITGGTINSTNIGATTAGTGKFTTLQATSGINSTAIGQSTAAAGAFTTLSASSGLDTTVIGANTAENGTFLNIVGSQITFSGSNESALSIYEFSQPTSTFTWGSTTTGAITITCIRIGRQVTVIVPAITITNSSSQSSQIISANTNLGARFQPASIPVVNNTYQNPPGTVSGYTRNYILTTGQIIFAGPLNAGISGSTNLEVDGTTFTYFV